jgi:hypothetical protein
MEELPNSSWNRWSQSEKNFILMTLCGIRLCMVTRKFLHSSLSMNFCDIVAFLLVRCISSLWDDDDEFCHMMHVNCGFLWIRMLDLISVNLVISWLVPGCSPWWLPNPGWIQDAADKQVADYCRGGLCICNGSSLKLVTNTNHWVTSFSWNTRYKLANKVTGTIKARYQYWLVGPTMWPVRWDIRNVGSPHVSLILISQ